MDEASPVLQQGETYSGFLTDVSFSSERELTIWAQIGNRVEDILNDVTEQLHDECSNLQHVSQLQVGLLCACKYVEDEQWYRASVVRQTLQGKWIARFIDYGNCQEFDSSEFFHLPPKLKHIPPLATALLLDGTLKPIGSAFLWTSATAKTLLDLLLYSEIEFTLSHICNGRAEISCSMINDALVTKGLAEFEKLRYPYSDFPIERKFDVYVSCATIRGTLLVQEIGSAVLLDQLMDLMTEHFGCLENRIALDAEDISPGCLVAAMYGCDQSFYRAQVVHIDGYEKCTIFYIDYGNEEEQAITSLFQLPKQFCQLPFQAIECELNDISIPPQKFSPELKEFLITKTSGVVINCTIVEHLFPSSVKFSVCAKCENDKLSSFLIAKNYARTRRDSQLPEYQYVEIEKGKQHQVYVSHVDQNGTFYVSLMSDAAKLDQLMSELEIYCAEAKSLSESYIGLACCALYDQDENWYRARIQRIDNGVYNVFYVDYGNSGTCELTSLRKMSKKFMSLRCQAIECSILRPLSDDEMIVLENLIGKMVEVKFLRKADKINSYNVKVVHEGEVLFPPLVKNDLPATDYEQQKIQVGTTENIKILSASSPDDMWGRLVCNDGQLQKLCADLNEFYNNNKSGSLKFEERIALDNLCAVLDTDFNQWCRGKVIAVKSSNSYSILLVDVGIVKTYSKNKISRIESRQLLKLPSQAFNFTLSGSKIVDIQKTNPSAFLSFFLDSTFSAEFQSYDNTSKLYTLQLFSGGKPVEEVMSQAFSRSVPDDKIELQSAGNSYEHVAKLQAALPIPLNETYVEVAICFVEDPDTMWLQLQSNAAILFQLINDMLTFYSQVPSNVLTFHQFQYDALCAVKVKNDGRENWYRGRILCSYADVIEVQLIDFGSEVKAKQKDVKMLSSRFSQPDAQAIKCKLFNVLPAAKRWSNSAVRDLTELASELGDSGVILAKFIERHRSSYIVDLKIQKKETRFHINAYLVEHKHAIWQDKSCIPEGASLSFESELSPKAAALSSGANKKPKVFYQSPGVAFVGAELDVFASEIKSPDDFFLQINDACHRQKYSALIRDLNAACTKSTSQTLLEENFYVGLPCAVFYNRVNQWCRGAILDYSDLESLQVCLVDYGCNICCPLNEVKSIDVQLVMQAPPEAMRCTVQGIVAPKGNKWTQDAIKLCGDFFESDQRNLNCTIHACAGNEFCSYFICSVRTPMRNLVDELVAAGCGVKTAVMGKVNPPLKLKSFIYSNLGQIKGKEDVYYVAHVEAQNLFYCQLSKQFPELDSMMDKLQLHCDSNTASVTVEELIRDCMCFAKYDDRWYRAHVVAPAGNDFVKVLFVDYGNTEVVQLCDVQKFSSDDFYELPIQALPCSFKDIETATTAADQQQETFTLMNTVLLEQEFDGVVIGSTNGKFHLDLFQDGKRINDVVIKKNVPENADVVAVGDKDKFLNDAQCNNIKLVEPFFLRNGITESVTVASCNDPHDFYLWLNKLDDERASCISMIDGQYTAMRNSDYKLQSISPGDVICARRSKDMKWCRAKVISINDNDVKVFYVDTGEFDTVLKAYDVKQLIVKMVKWPRMAIHCTLGGIEAADIDGWSSKAVLEFQILIKNCQLSAQFVKKDQKSDKWVVELKKGDVKVSDHFVEMGVAKVVNPSSNVEVVIDLPSTWEGEKEVFISCVESRNQVYLQSIDAFDAAEDLKKQIHDDKNLQQLTKKPEPKSFCIARYDVDGQLYRAKVLDASLKDDSSKVCVQFVDFGNSSFVQVGDMFVLDLKYAKALQLAVPCKISSIPATLSPSEVVKKLEDLSLAEDVSIFASFDKSEFGDDNTVNLQVCQNDDHRMSLDLYLTKHDSATKAVIESAQLKYTVIENILNQTSRSIYVSHVESPGHVYCQLSEFCNDLDTLMDSIEDYYGVDRPENEIKTAESLPVGSPCVAKYAADNAWYRAIVEDVVDEDKLKVRFVDYGNSETLSLSMVRKSKVGFCTLPIQAIHCYLALVDHETSVWTGDEINDFDSRVATLQLKATFSRLIDEKASIFEVMLRLPDETLLNKDYIKNNSAAAAGKSSDSFADMNHADFASTSSKHVVEGQRNSAEDIVVDEMRLIEGQAKDCYISYAESISNFYLQIAGTENDLALLFGLVSKDAESKVNINKESFQVGRHCVAQSPDDGEWYRGKISKLDPQPTVFFIDYGNCSIVDWSFVKPMSKTSSSLPAQAISCTLSGLSSLSPEMISQAVDVFFDLVESTMISVKFLRKINSIWEVSIRVGNVDVTERILEEISKKFPDFNVPSRVDKDLVPAENLASTSSNVSTLIDICPNRILLCKVVFVTSVASFFVKTTTEVASSSTALISSACAVKQSKDSSKKAVKVHTSEGDLIIMENGDACLSNEVEEVNTLENDQAISFQVFHCSLGDSDDLSKDETTNVLFNREVTSKDTFVTFKSYDQKNLKWVVEMSLFGGNLSQLIQKKDKSGVELAQALADEEQVHRGGIEECIRYNTLVFKQLKEMVQDNQAQEKVISLIDNAVQKLEVYHLSLSKSTLVDEHKRPFSEYLSNPSPCKKPRLDKRQGSYNSASPVFETIPELDEKKSNDISVFDQLESTLVCGESPDNFYVKPRAFSGHILPVVAVDQLHKLDVVKSSVLCAFYDDEKGPDVTKRGFILSESCDTVVVLDIDSGFQFVLAPDKVFMYPNAWNSFQPLVVKCSLYGVVPVGREWSAEACVFFNELVEGATEEDVVFVEFVQKNEADGPVQDWKVSVAIGDNSLSNQLIERNFAQYVEEDVEEKFQILPQVPASQSNLPEYVEQEIDEKENKFDRDEVSGDIDLKQEGGELEMVDKEEFDKSENVLSKEDSQCPPGSSEDVPALEAEENLLVSEPTAVNGLDEGSQKTVEEDTHVTPPLYVKKAIGYKLKLVDSASSYLSDSVFGEDKDFSEVTTGEEPFSVPLSSARSGNAADERVPGFVTPVKTAGKRFEGTPDSEAEVIKGEEPFSVPLISSRSGNVADERMPGFVTPVKTAGKRFEGTPDSEAEVIKDHVVSHTLTFHDSQPSDLTRPETGDVSRPDVTGRDVSSAALDNVGKSDNVQDAPSDGDPVNYCTPIDETHVSPESLRKQRLPTFIACGGVCVQEHFSPPRLAAETVAEKQGSVSADLVAMEESQDLNDSRRSEDKISCSSAGENESQKLSDSALSDGDGQRQGAVSVDVQSSLDPTADQEKQFEEVNEELLSKLTLSSHEAKDVESSSDVDDADGVELNYVTVEESLKSAGGTKDVSNDVIDQDRSFFRESASEIEIDAKEEEQFTESLKAEDSTAIQEETEQKDFFFFSSDESKADSLMQPSFDDAQADEENESTEKIVVVSLPSVEDDETATNLLMSRVALSTDENEVEKTSVLDQSSAVKKGASSIDDDPLDPAGLSDSTKTQLESEVSEESEPNREESEIATSKESEVNEELEPNRKESEIAKSEELNPNLEDSDSDGEDSELAIETGEETMKTIPASSQPDHVESESSFDKSSGNVDESQPIEEVSSTIDMPAATNSDDSHRHPNDEVQAPLVSQDADEVDESKDEDFYDAES